MSTIAVVVGVAVLVLLVVAILLRDQLLFVARHRWWPDEYDLREWRRRHKRSAPAPVQRRPAPVAGRPRPLAAPPSGPRPEPPRAEQPASDRGERAIGVSASTPESTPEPGPHPANQPEPHAAPEREPASARPPASRPDPETEREREPEPQFARPSPPAGAVQVLRGEVVPARTTAMERWEPTGRTVIAGALATTSAIAALWALRRAHQHRLRPPAPSKGRRHPPSKRAVHGRRR